MKVEFKKFPSIERFPNVMKNVKRNRNNVDYSDVTYRAKVKLHGTNAALIIHCVDGEVSFHAQKRTSLIDLNGDNFGFAFWVSQKEKQFREDPNFERKLENVLNRNRGKNYKEYVFGEWVGPGIQKGVALSNIEKKVFCPFKSIIVDENDNEEWIDMSYDSYYDDDVFPIPIFKEYKVDLTSSESIQSFIDEVNVDVLKVEECDPFVKEHFGVEGIGEGLVLEVEGKPELTFKAKGEKHSVSKQSKPVVKDFLKQTKIEEYIETHVTENRVRQGIQETGADELKNIPDVIRWVVVDVQKECLDNLGEGLEWDDVRKRIGNTAAKMTKEILTNEWSE